MSLMQSSSGSQRLLAGVRRVSYHLGSGRCPEGTPLPACLSAMLEFLGQDLGARVIQAHGSDWRLNLTYAECMALSGAAFRIVWKVGAWCPAAVDVLHADEDATGFARRVFDAFGWRAHYLENAEVLEEHDPLFATRVSASDLREALVQSVDHGRPAISFGPVGPPEASLIVGYEDHGATLVGWSFFQDDPAERFHARDWTKGLRRAIVLDQQVATREHRECVRTALEWAFMHSKFGMCRGYRVGLAAFQAWEDDLREIDGLPDSGDASEAERQHVAHDDAVGALAEGRWYAAQWLRETALSIPSARGCLLDAAAHYEAIHDLMWQVWGLVGGLGRSPEKIARFADGEVRRRAADLVEQAKRHEIAALSALNQSLMAI